MSKKIPTLLTDHKLLIWLANIPERLRWIYTSAILGGCIFIWGAFLYAPLLWRIYKDKKQITQNETARIVLSQQAQKGTQLKKENEEMKHFLQNSVVPQSYQIADSLVTLANKVGVVCSSIVPIEKERGGAASARSRTKARGAASAQHHIKRSNNFQKNRIKLPLYEVGLKGAFSSVLKFLDQLQQLPAVHSIKDFACSRTEDNKVEVTLTIEVARRTL